MSIAHQLLFGYDDGHRLLAGSRELSGDTLVRLLGATDAGMSAESAPLVTGVPLPDSREYAFCVTWPAPEVPRAGAVWAHVLIVKAAELHDTEHCEALLALPRRPSSVHADLSEYTTPLDLDLPRGDVQARLAPQRHDRAVLDQIVAAAYSSPDAAICVQDDLGAATRAVLSLWCAQWPQLRSAFSFRTRQVVRREPSSFDLTVAAKVRGDDEHGLAPGPQRAPDWIAAIVRDLLAPGGTPLRNFLLTFGPDGPPDRVAVRRLAKLWLRVVAADPLRVRAYVERHWPDPSAGAKLKYSLFGSAQNVWWSLDERTRVRTLMLSQSDAWDLEELELKHRARALGID